MSQAKLLPFPYKNQRGALVLSLDFELQWGVRDHHAPGSPYTKHILGARRAIPQMLDLFEEFAVSATWATVGALFAESREELLHFAPALRASSEGQPGGAAAAGLGKSEADDPLHFAPSLIADIQSRRGQEIGCHTLSHFYCRASGADVAAFQADVHGAVLLARERGIDLTSFVFPRNQVTDATLAVLPGLGFTAYRGGEPGWLHDTRPKVRNQWHRKAGRYLDQHLAPPSRLVDWTVLSPQSGLSNVRGSFFLRPFQANKKLLNRWRLRRLTAAMRTAAARGQILHLWWHPHNFGGDLPSNLEALRCLLESFAECRERFGFNSLTMAEAAAVAGAGRGDLKAWSATGEPAFSARP